MTLKLRRDGGFDIDLSELPPKAVEYLTSDEGAKLALIEPFTAVATALAQVSAVASAAFRSNQRNARQLAKEVARRDATLAALKNATRDRAIQADRYRELREFEAMSWQDRAAIETVDQVRYRRILKLKQQLEHELSPVDGDGPQAA